MAPGAGIHADTEQVPVYITPWCGEGWYLLTDEGLYVFTERTTP
ncbi:hypothetical protein [Gordonia asplenii]|nr:hypothetical protein [Gordonia asplenii]